MCLEGNALLCELCQKHRISCKKIGKIILATNDTEAEELEKLYKRARNNGVELKWASMPALTLVGECALALFVILMKQIIRLIIQGGKPSARRP